MAGELERMAKERKKPKFRGFCPNPESLGCAGTEGASSPQLLLKLRFGLRNAVIPGQKYDYCPKDL